MIIMEQYRSLIIRLIDNQFTNQMVSDYLKANFGFQKGFSVRSVKRFIADSGLRPTPATTADLAIDVAVAINEVGFSYGRKTMTGYLRSKQVICGESRVGQLLRQNNQPYHILRRQGARNLNPHPYFAEYFGHNLHLDQNEKLNYFGITTVIAVDGFANLIVSYAVMPIKNNFIIYEDVYRKAVMEYGIWDQLRTDFGGEFNLTLFIQWTMRNMRHNLERPPYIQTSSKRNHKVERMWVELNNRVNFPIKAAFNDMLSRDLLDMDDNITRFCTSHFGSELVTIGLDRVASAWTHHRIPGHGIPIERAQIQFRMNPSINLPHANEAGQMYFAETGNHLNPEPPFAMNPFPSQDALEQCSTEFVSRYPDRKHLFDSIVNFDYFPAQTALLELITIVKQFCN